MTGLAPAAANAAINAPAGVAAVMCAERCALVLVDYQGRLMPMIEGHQAVLREAQRLADAAACLDVPVIGTEQNPLRLGPNVDSLRQRCASTLAKTHFDACEDGLLPALDAHAPGRPEVVVAGCEAHVCLLQTALGLLRAGRRVWVVGPACGSRIASNHALALQRLAAAGAVVVSAEMVLFEWLHDCRHPRFREVLSLIKAT
jgi:nicotinamidase-related amidase